MTPERAPVSPLGELFRLRGAHIATPAAMTSCSHKSMCKEHRDFDLKLLLAALPASFSKLIAYRAALMAVRVMGEVRLSALLGLSLVLTASCHPVMDEASWFARWFLLRVDVFA